MNLNILKLTGWCQFAVTKFHNIFAYLSLDQGSGSELVMSTKKKKSATLEYLDETDDECSSPEKIRLLEREPKVGPESVLLIEMAPLLNFVLKYENGCFGIVFLLL